ncbi:MAG: hypothetical protein RIT27_346 [Pseudomonadota bacterium]|jgi:hypothetical protein
MENTIELSVFGEPKLIKGQQVLLTAPLPLLIAAFVVIEYNGEADRNEVFQVFFPQEPTAPDEFSKLSQVIYQQLWNHLAQSPNVPTLLIKKDFLRHAINRDLSKPLLQRAHEQLQKYAIIERVTQEDAGFRYWADSRFKNYLTKKEEKNGTDKTQLARKTFSQHISLLRKEIGENGVPSCKTEKKSLVIRLLCTTTALETALSAQAIESIHKIYSAPFLENIEQLFRGDVWLPPHLRAWIEQQRAYFESQVKNITLNNSSKEFKKESTEIPPLPTIQPIVFQPIIKGQLPSYLRRHLLNKTDEECEILLQTKGATPRSRVGWISTSVNVQRSDLWTDIQVESRDPALLPLFLEKSYGFAVLLGEAGMGKTLVLCHLAQTLIQQARKEIEKPIPFVLHLADWARRGGSFEAWLTYRLVRLGVGEKHIDTYLEHLLNAQQCLLLLDGFDNLPPLQRPVYLQRLNRFVDEYGEAHLGGIILASRPEEYRIARHQLLEITQNNTDFYFHTEATLQPLTQTAAHIYLTTHTPISAENTEHLFKIDGLNEFLHIPLGLILFAHTAQHSIENLDTSRSAEDIKNNLVKNYIQKQLTNAAEKSPYSPQQVETWLAYLARYLNMGETFHLENLSPRLLTPAQQQHYQTTFAIIFGVVFGLMMGSVAGLIFGDRIADVDKIPQPPATEGFFLVVYEIFQFWDKYGDWGDKSNFVIIYACIGVVIALTLSRVLFLLSGRLEFSLFLGGYLAIFMGFTGWLMDGAPWSFFTATFYGILGIVLGLMVDPVHTNPQVIALGQDARFTFKRLFQDKRKLLLGLLFIPIGVGLMLAFRNALPTLSLPLAILNGLVVGLSFTLAYLAYHSQSQQDWDSQIFFSTQKLQVALKRSLIMMLSIGITVTLLVTLIGFFATLTGSIRLGGLGSLSFGLRIGIPLGIILGFLFYGGIEILKHLALRWVMYRKNLAPLNYPAFLEHTNDWHLLISRSGGYAFRHDWFQEYFLSGVAVK